MNTFHKDMQNSMICPSCKKFTEAFITMCANYTNVCKGCKPNPEICSDCGGILPSSKNKPLQDNAEGPSDAGEIEFIPNHPTAEPQNSQRTSSVNSYQWQGCRYITWK
ncbi:uncharacterized protein [Periplaneta americana]|uniref:uncharacterized protein isoform X2 n=1 Tax=Periplaneta americana TaxID=6978 RepID=UPI0037E71832